MLSLQRTGSNFLPYPQNHLTQHHHHPHPHNRNNYTTTPSSMENHYHVEHDSELPWFARPIGPSVVNSTGAKTSFSGAQFVRDKEFVTSSNPPIAMTATMAAAAKMKNVTICGGGRLAGGGGGSGSSNSTLSRSVSPSSAEESFVNRRNTNQEDSYYSFYPSNNEEEKIRSAHRFITNVRDEELHLPEGKNCVKLKAAMYV